MQLSPRTTREIVGSTHRSLSNDETLLRWNFLLPPPPSLFVFLFLLVIFTRLRATTRYIGNLIVTYITYIVSSGYVYYTSSLLDKSFASRGCRSIELRNANLT